MNHVKQSVAVLAIVLMAGVGFAGPTVDLTTANSSGMINGALFSHSSVQPTGTGVLDPFVRIEDKGVEEGYNTDYRPVPYDENNSQQYTHSVLVSNIPVMTVDGVKYREFLLDINQKASQPLLSLDVMQIYLATSGNLHGVPSSLGNLVYDLDAGGDHYILLNYNLGTGSGSGDMRAYIPDHLFSGYSNTPYVYLYSVFGLDIENRDAKANAGFEEWGVREGATPPPVTVPAPAAIVLGSLGMGLVGMLRRRHSL